MELIDLATQAGLNPKKESMTKGGEYSSPCPACPDGGKDRFRIWPNEGRNGRYWCRRCNVHGDSVQFCRDFLGMSFQEAISRLGGSSVVYNFPLNAPSSSSPIHLPTDSWQKKAKSFCASSHQSLLKDIPAISFLKSKYGLNLDTIRLYRIGWNPEKQFHCRSEWGLSDPDKKICLPRGPVIPGIIDGNLSKLKIRDLEWKEGNPYGKYREIPGSTNRPIIFGFWTNEVAVVVESEFDAMLLIQEIGEFCTCIALGGAQKRLDVITHEWLKKKRFILYCLDSDQAGKNEYRYWRETFPQLRAWPANIGKSPADSFVEGKVNLREWYAEGVSYWKNSP